MRLRILARHVAYRPAVVGRLRALRRSTGLESPATRDGRFLRILVLAICRFGEQASTTVSGLQLGSGGLSIGWLALNTGSGFAGLLFRLGMFVGRAVFACSATGVVRSPDCRWV